MINNQSVLAIIPARGNSKGLPGKNLRMIAGRTLLNWTIETAQQSKLIDRLVLSSEDDSIIRVAKQAGCEVPFIRPKALAQDSTPGIDPVLHALKELPHYDYVVLLQVTSPLRSTADIDNAIMLCEQQQASACVSVSEAACHPDWTFSVDEQHKLSSYTKKELATHRQQLAKAYSLNGAVYVAKTEQLKKNKTFLNDETIAYPMPRTRSVDIDDEIDFQLAQLLFKREGVPGCCAVND